MGDRHFTTVYFKVTWVPQTGRSSDSSPRVLSVKIFKDDLLTSAPYLDSYGLSQLHMKLIIALENEFPDFSREAHQIVFMDWNGDGIVLENKSDLQVIINKHYGLAGTVIRLRVEQRVHADSGAKYLCRECSSSITQVMFKCVECTDYNLCGSCVTTRKHAQHIVIRVTDSKMDVETVLKRLMVSPKHDLNADLRDLRDNPELERGSQQCYAAAGECRSNEISVFSSTNPFRTSTPREKSARKQKLVTHLKDMLDLLAISSDDENDSLLSSVETSKPSPLGAAPKDYQLGDTVSLSSLDYEMDGFKSGCTSSSASVWVLEDPAYSPHPFTQLQRTESTSM